MTFHIEFIIEMCASREKKDTLGSTTDRESQRCYLSYMVDTTKDVVTSWFWNSGCSILIQRDGEPSSSFLARHPRTFSKPKVLKETTKESEEVRSSAMPRSPCFFRCLHDFSIFYYLVHLKCFVNNNLQQGVMATSADAKHFMKLLFPLFYEILQRAQL
jgi:hypothetical protein